jgi:hypothetical protein
VSNEKIPLRNTIFVEILIGASTLNDIAKENESTPLLRVASRMSELMTLGNFESLGDVTLERKLISWSMSN